MEELTELIFKYFVNVGIPIILSVVGFYVSKAIKAFEKKTKIDISSNVENLLRNLAEESVQYVAERVADELKHSNVTKRISGSGVQKLNAAVDFLMDRIELDMPEERMTRYQAGKYVEAALNRIKKEDAKLYGDNSVG